jgi:hypothetical protein
MRSDIGVIEKANKLLEQHLYCEIDDEQLKIEMDKIGVDIDDMNQMINDGHADDFENQNLFDNDWNPYFGCYNSDFQN